MQLDETESPLVLVRPDDRAETVLARVIATGALRVQLLVPPGVVALQQPQEADCLSRLATAAGISLVLLSADPATLEAARLGAIPTVTLSAAPVRPRPAPPAAPTSPIMPAPPVPPASSPYRTQVLDKAAATPPVAPTSPVTPVPPVSPASSPYRTQALDKAVPTPPVAKAPSTDDAFLASLDELDAGLAARPPAAGDADVSAATASLAAALKEPQAPPVRSRAADDAEVSAATASLEAALKEPAGPPVRSRAAGDADGAAATASLEAALKEPAGPPVRSRAADDLLSAALTDEAALPPPARPRPHRAPPPNPRPQSAPAPQTQRRREPRSAPVAAAPVRRMWLIGALALALLMLVVGVLAWDSRVTVAVTPPVRLELVEQLTALPVPIIAPGSVTTTAVQAERLSADVSFMSEGQVTEGTRIPSGSAGGTVTIFNSTQQTIVLPAGTEFIAVQEGKDVPFVSTADVQVPGATTSDTGAQVITSRGQASLTVLARSPGSASNVAANTIKRVAPSGGVPFNVNTGGFIVQHAALTGGSEEEARIVKDDNVQALMLPALEGLDAEARRQLDAQARAHGLSLDLNTIMPRRTDLEHLQGFETNVQPMAGQAVDPANPRFTLTVRAPYSALAVPPDKPLDRQLGPVLAEQLMQAGRIVAGDCRAPSVTNWRWDRESLLVDGRIAPDVLSLGCTGGLDAALLNRVREVVRGKTRDEARAALDALVAQGLIGTYSLPNVQHLPLWDWQIEVRG